MLLSLYLFPLGAAITGKATSVCVQMTGKVSLSKRWRVYDLAPLLSLLLFSFLGRYTNSIFRVGNTDTAFPGRRFSAARLSDILFSS
jgi:hypothetical protein